MVGVQRKKPAMAIQTTGGAAAASNSKERNSARRNTRIIKGAYGRFIIHPSSRKKIAFDVCLIGCLIYTVTVTPLKLAFGVQEPCPSFAWLFDLFIDMYAHAAQPSHAVDLSLV